MHRSVALFACTSALAVTALALAPAASAEASEASTGPHATTWLTGDLTGDGHDEVLRFSPTTGQWMVGVADEDGNLEFSVWGSFTTRHGWQTHLTGDYNGDGRDQIASFHRNGNWITTTAHGTTLNSSVTGSFTTRDGWQTHLTGDYNGDGRDQIANAHRNGNWIVATVGDDGLQSRVRGWLAPDFRWQVTRVPRAERDRMRGVTWRPGCPVGLDELRMIELTHRDFEGRIRRGRLIAHAGVVDDLGWVFSTMFQTGVPLSSVEPAHAYGGDDDAIMAANASHAFNCRRITGGTRWSEHAFGTAIDLNPVQNPYVRGGDVKPPAGSAYLDRADVRPGMLVEGDAVVRRFDRQGWEWGGRWHSLVDYMHVERPR